MQLYQCVSATDPAQSQDWIASTETTWERARYAAGVWETFGSRLLEEALGEAIGRRIVRGASGSSTAGAWGTRWSSSWYRPRRAAERRGPLVMRCSRLDQGVRWGLMLPVWPGAGGGYDNGPPACFSGHGPAARRAAGVAGASWAPASRRPATGW